jgi:hypothetical protein
MAMCMMLFIMCQISMVGKKRCYSKNPGMTFAPMGSESDLNSNIANARATAVVVVMLSLEV